jgi:adenylyltransferase/sulfurtransferase
MAFRCLRAYRLGMSPQQLDRYTRQRLFPEIGIQGQERLLESRVAIVGCGALGTHAASTLVRAGVGSTLLIDRDFVELSNLQRQTLFDESDVHEGLPKAIAAALRLQKVNSQVTLRTAVIDLTGANAEAVLSNVDLVLDGTDNFYTRYLINDVCTKLKLPWIYAGVVGGNGMTMTFMPGQGPCFRCVFPEAPPAGLNPTCDTAGILESAAAVLSGFQCVEALKILSGNPAALKKGLLHVDVWERQFLSLDPGAKREDCPCCVAGNFEYLRQENAILTTQLCGRDAVQVSLSAPAQLDLAQLALRLEPLGEVRLNRFMLRAFIDKYELSVFPDGRCIVKGTTDEVVAKAVHARYIGD